MFSQEIDYCQVIFDHHRAGVRTFKRNHESECNLLYSSCSFMAFTGYSCLYLFSSCGQAALLWGRICRQWPATSNGPRSFVAVSSPTGATSVSWPMCMYRPWLSDANMFIWYVCDSRIFQDNPLLYKVAFQSFRAFCQSSGLVRSRWCSPKMRACSGVLGPAWWTVVLRVDRRLAGNLPEPLKQAPTRAGLRHGPVLCQLQSCSKHTKKSRQIFFFFFFKSNSCGTNTSVL